MATAKRFSLVNVVNSLGRDRRGEEGLVRGVAWTALSALPVITLETILLLSKEESLEGCPNLTFSFL